MNEHTVVIASDHAGVTLKEMLVADMKAQGCNVHDLGPYNTQSVDYPDYASKLALWMKDRPESKGILICGSGIGMSIAANRHPWVRAALCQDGLSARLSRQHNNANVLCLGERLVGTETAKDCVKQFLDTAFEGGRHLARVNKLRSLQNEE